MTHHPLDAVIEASVKAGLRVPLNNVEIAALLGCDQSYVARLERRAMKKLTAIARQRRGCLELMRGAA